MAFFSLRDLMRKREGRFGHSKHADLALIRSIWVDVFRNNPASKVTPTELRTGYVLVVRCSSLAEAAQLRLQEEHFCTQLNSRLPKEKQVKKIVFKVN